MVEKNLSNKMIESGLELLKGLDKSGVKPNAAFWYFFQDIQSYKLVLGEPNVGKVGPRDIYKKIQKILSKLPNDKRLLLDDISLLKPKSSLIALLKTAIQTGSDYNGIRFMNNVINGNLIEDAYIYRLK